MLFTLVGPIIQEKPAADHLAQRRSDDSLDDSSHYLGDENGSSRCRRGSFTEFRTQPLINPFLCLLYDVFLCLPFSAEHGAASYDEIIKSEFLGKLDVGSCCPGTSGFILRNRWQDQVLAIPY